MKICDKHWDELQAGIDEAGLGHLVSPTPEEATRRSEEWQVKGGDDASNFDPLLGCIVCISASALNSRGKYLLEPDEHGNPYCPVCESEKNGCEGWIKESIGMAQARARELGLIRLN